MMKHNSDLTWTQKVVSWIVPPHILLRFPEDRRGKVQSFTWVNLVMAQLWYGFSLQYKGLGMPFAQWFPIFALGIVINILPFLFRLGMSVRMGGNIVSAITWFTLFWVAWFDGGIVNQALLSFPATCVLAVAFCSRRDNIFWTIFPAVSLVALYLLESKGIYHFERLVDENEAKKLLMFSIMSVITVFSVTLALYEKAESKLRDTVLTQEKIVAQSSKLASLGQMAAGVAHELNTPLAAVVNYAGMLETAANLPADKVNKIGLSIKKATQHMAMITDGLLKYCRPASADQHVRISVADWVKQTIELFNSSLKQGRKVALRVTPGPDSFIEGNSGELTQLLVILLSNAFDAVPAEGGEVEIGWSADSGSVRVMTTDNGPGVPPNIKEKIFEPFFTTKPLGKGAGLGLSIGIGIVKSHSGRLYLREGAGKTTFVIEMPEAGKQKAAA